MGNLKEVTITLDYLARFCRAWDSRMQAFDYRWQNGECLFESLYRTYFKVEEVPDEVWDKYFPDRKNTFVQRFELLDLDENDG